MTRPKAIAFDLDGTLAESKQRVGADMGVLLGELMGRMPVAIMSGAGFPQFQTQLLPALPEDANLERLYLFPENAGQCFVFNSGSWRPQYDYSFTEKEKETIYAALREALAETGLDTPPPQLWGEQTEDRGAQITWSALGQQAPLEVKSVWDPDRSKRMPLRDALLRRLPDFSIGVNATNSIDITRKGITKAYGIRRLAELTGVPIADMLYVGDALEEGGNDAVVMETGVPTHAVFGPAETAACIEHLLNTPSAAKSATLEA